MGAIPNRACSSPRDKSCRRPFIVLALLGVSLSWFPAVAQQDPYWDAGFPERAIGVPNVVNFNPEGQDPVVAHLAGAVSLAGFPNSLDERGGGGGGDEEEDGGGEEEGGGEGNEAIADGFIMTHPGCNGLSRVPHAVNERALGFHVTPAIKSVAVLGTSTIIGVTTTGTVVTLNAADVVRDAGTGSGPSGEELPTAPPAVDHARRFKAKHLRAGWLHREAPAGPHRKRDRRRRGNENTTDPTTLRKYRIVVNAKAAPGPVPVCTGNPSMSSPSISSFGDPGTDNSWSFKSGNGDNSHLSSNPGQIAAIESMFGGDPLVFVADTGSHVIGQVQFFGGPPGWLKNFYGEIDRSGITTNGMEEQPTGRVASPKAIAAAYVPMLGELVGPPVEGPEQAVSRRMRAESDRELDPIEELGLFVGMSDGTTCGVIQFGVTEDDGVTVGSIFVVTMRPCVVSDDPWTLAGNPTGLAYQRSTETLFIADGTASRIVGYNVGSDSFGLLYSPSLEEGGGEVSQRRFRALSQGALTFGPLVVLTRDSGDGVLLVLHEAESSVYTVGDLPTEPWSGFEAPINVVTTTTTDAPSGQATPAPTTAAPTRPPTTTDAPTAPPKRRSPTRVPLAPQRTGTYTASHTITLAPAKVTPTLSRTVSPTQTRSETLPSTRTPSQGTHEPTASKHMTSTPTVPLPPTTSVTGSHTPSLPRTTSVSVSKSRSLSSSARTVTHSGRSGTFSALPTLSHARTTSMSHTTTRNVTGSRSADVTDSAPVTESRPITLSVSEPVSGSVSGTLIPPPPPTQPDVDPSAALGAMSAGTAIGAGAAAMTGSSPVGDAQALVVVGLMGCAAESTKKSMAPSSPLVAPLDIGTGEYSALAGCVTIMVAFGVFHAIGADLTVNISRRKARATKRKLLAERRRKQRKERKRRGIADSPQRDGSSSGDATDSADERARIRREANEELKAAERAELDDSDNEELADMNRKAYAKSKFPAVTLSVFNFMLPGTSFFAMREIISPGTRTVVGTVLGSMAVLFICGVIAATAYAVQSSNFDGVYCRYTQAFKKTNPRVRTLLLPRGFWTKNSFTHRFGPAFKSAKRRRCVYFFSVITPLKTLIFSFFAAMNPELLFGEGTCWLQWCFIAVVCIVYAAIVVLMRPFRMPLGNVLTVLGQVSMLVLCLSQLTPLMQAEMSKAAVTCALTVAVLAGVIGVASPLMERFVWQKKELKMRKKAKPVFGEKKWSVAEADDEEIDEFGDSDEEERLKDEAAAKRVARRKKDVVNADAKRTTHRALKKEQRRKQREQRRQPQDQTSSSSDPSDDEDVDSYDTDAQTSPRGRRARNQRGAAEPLLSVPSRAGQGGVSASGGAPTATGSTTMMALLGGEDPSDRPYNPFLGASSKRGVQHVDVDSDEASDPASSNNSGPPDEAVTSGMMIFGALPRATPNSRKRDDVEL